MDVIRTVLTSPSRRAVTPRASIDTEPTCVGAGAPSTATVANVPSTSGAVGSAPRNRAWICSARDFLLHNPIAGLVPASRSVSCIEVSSRQSKEEYLTPLGKQSGQDGVFASRTEK